MVIAIERDSSAARAGIQVGDVIEEVNREPVRSLDDFDNATTAASDINLQPADDTSSIRLLRQRD